MDYCDSVIANNFVPCNLLFHLLRCALSALEVSWAKAQKGAIRHFESADRHSKSAKWYSWMIIALSCSSAFWTSFLGFLEPGLTLRRVFKLYS